MATVQPNAFYTGSNYDPTARAAEVSQGIGGLAEALFGNPGKAAAFQNQQSETQKNLADALLSGQKFTARDKGIADAVKSGLASPQAFHDSLPALLAADAQAEQNPAQQKEYFDAIEQRDAGLKTSGDVAVERAKPLNESQVKAQILQSLMMKDPKAAQTAAFPPRANGDVVFDPQSGTMTTVDNPTPADIASSPQQHGAVDYAAPVAPVDKSTMGSMINSLGAPADQPIPKGPALPPPALNSTLSPDLPPAAAKDITKAATPLGAAQPQPQQVNNAPAFGFAVPHSLNKEVYKSMVDNDNKLFAAQNVNDVKAKNVMSLLDEIEPNLNNFKTGFAGGARLMVDKALAQIGDGSMGGPAATAGANIDTKTQALVNELQGFQPSPGARNSVMGLQTLLASKPGISQPPQTNLSTMAEIRSKVTDYNLSTELQQRYREASPMHITDANTHTLDDALKTIFPLQNTDQKTGAVTFNKANALKIHQAIPDAIANPKAYIDKANAIFSGQAQPEAQGPATGGVLHVDAKGNKAMVFPDGHFEEVH